MVWTLQKKDWFHQDGFFIEVARREPQAPFGLHAHEFYEIVMVTGGTGLHVNESETWRLSAGDLFVIGGTHKVHDYQEMQGLRLINILFDPQALQGHIPMLDLNSLPGHRALFTLEPAWRKQHRFESRLRLNFTDLAYVNALVDRLDEELTRRAAGFQFLATAIFMQMIGFLSRRYSEQDHPDSRALLRLAETIAYVEEHFHEEVSLDDLARMAHMSRRSLIRAFESATGSSPIAYLIQLRINKAAELLRKHDANVTEAAFQVGFNDSSYFSRQFRKVLGVSPSKYREQHGATI